MSQPGIGPRPAASVPETDLAIDARGLPAEYRARVMTIDDIDVVHALELALFPEDAWPVDMFLAEIGHPSRRYTVVEKDGVVIAYAGMMAIAETGDVQTIAVLPDHEGRGIGRWLMTRMHDQARAMRAETMMLEVRADNPRAQNLYGSMGYHKVHKRRGYYQGGVDAVIMSLDLTGARDLNKKGPTH